MKYMKRLIAAWVVTVSLLAACDNNKPADKPMTATDTGRDFIRATLDGDFKTADALLLDDEHNRELFASYKSFYAHMPEDKKQAYKKASYNINTFTDVNDSVSLINYSNSYMNQPMNIKLVKKNNEWKVDFKYTSEATDSVK